MPEKQTATDDAIGLTAFDPAMSGPAEDQCTATHATYCKPRWRR